MENQQAKKIRWGIIGPGRIAVKFAQDLAKVSNCELYGVASRNPEDAIGFARKYNAKVAFNTFEELAKSNEIDAVYIATPHSFHKEHSVLCLQNKKAVLCEKPFAMNAIEVQEMIDAAKENNMLLMEGMWTRFLPHFKYAFDLINTKKYVNIHKLEVDFGFFTPYDLENRVFTKNVGGGSLLDIGVYNIFTALISLGIPNTIEANADFFENGADATCNMVFKYDTLDAFLTCTLTADTATEAIFTCENAIVKINGRFNEPSSVTEIIDGKVETTQFPIDNFGFYFEIEHFNELFRKGKKESDVLPLNLSLDLIETLDKVRNLIGLEY